MPKLVFWFSLAAVWLVSILFGVLNMPPDYISPRTARLFCALIALYIYMAAASTRPRLNWWKDLVTGWPFYVPIFAMLGIVLWDTTNELRRLLS